MSRVFYAVAAAALAAASLGVAAYAQQPAPPPFATTKVDGTDNVYVFRYGNHQAMFVVTSAGVIATDPIGYGRPQAVVTYVDEIKKVTTQPIKYLIYSHHHFDHIAGGKPFKDAGAVIVSHKRAWELLNSLKDPHTVLPDATVGDNWTITLGDTTLELSYLGLNHSDSTIVMRLPKQKVLFAVDFIPIGTVPGRGMIDFYPLEAEDSLKKVLAMDWDKLIPGHPGAPGGRLGTKKDVQDQLTFLQDASAAVKAEAQAGKCWDGVEKELKLPKYQSWPGYEQNLPFVLRRYCGLWGRGT
jgi:glyoxylase-like metal-dependent hydrolase (beta-lactamase superfamily II)